MNRNVLVVDDDRTMVRTLRDILQLRGWEPTVAYTGDEAVEAVRNGEFTLVLMDIKMPGTNGVSAFKAMKALRNDIRVVLMTAYTAQDLISEAEREGVVRVLPKPVDLPRLLSLVEQSARRQQPVLIVDYEAAFLSSLQDVLREKGYRTVTAGTVEEAAARLREASTAPAVVLLHLVVGKGGPQPTVAAVHELSDSAAVIVYSGRPDAIDRARESVPNGWVRAYLEKPFSIEELTGLLDDLVG